MERKVYFCSVEFRESSLSKTPEVLYSVYMNPCSCSLWELMISIIDSEVSFTRNIYKPIISTPTIRIENRLIKVHLTSYYGPQSICLTVWNNLCVYFYPSSLILSFYKSEYWLFQCSSSSFEFTSKSSFSLGSEVAFVDFYFSAYFFFEGIHSMKIDYFSKDTKISVYCIWI